MNRTRVGAALLAFGLVGAGCVYEGDIAGMDGGLMVLTAGDARGHLCATDTSEYLETDSALKDDLDDFPLGLAEEVSSEVAFSSDPRLEGATKIDLETVTDLERGLGSVHGEITVSDDGDRRFDGEIGGTMVAEIVGDGFLLGLVNGHIDGDVESLEVDEEEYSSEGRRGERDELPGGRLESDFVGLYLVLSEGVTDGEEVEAEHNRSLHSDLTNIFVLALGGFDEDFIGGSLSEEAAVDRLIDALPKEVAAEVEAEDIDIDDFLSTNGSSWFRPDERCFDFDDERDEAQKSEKVKAPKAEKTPKPEKSPKDDDGDEEPEPDSSKRRGKDAETSEEGSSEVEETLVEEEVIVEETASPLE